MVKTANNNRYELTFKVSDEFGGISSYPLSINVTNSQEPPVLLTTLSTVEISEDESPISWESEWAGVDVQDPDGGILTWSILQNGIYGVAEVEVNTGEIDYIPNPNQFGDDNFTVNVNDGDFDMNFTVYIRINQVNDPPEIMQQVAPLDRKLLGWKILLPVILLKLFLLAIL